MYWEQQAKKRYYVLDCLNVINHMNKNNIEVTYRNVLEYLDNPRLAAQVISVYRGHNTVDNVCFSSEDYS